MFSCTPVPRPKILPMRAAGQQERYLNIQGKAVVLEASFALHRRAINYRKAKSFII